MKFTGTITAVGLPREGTSSAGNAWKSQTFVIEEDAERAPMSVAFDVWGDKFQFSKGEKCTVFLDVKASESKDGARWFNNIQVFKKEGGNPAKSTPTQTASAPSEPVNATAESDDLPF